jgi:chromosomal replication initiator protein
MKANPSQLWDQSLLLIKDNVTEQQFNTWFKSIVLESYNDKTHTLRLQVPSMFAYEYLEENYLELLSAVLSRTFG